MTLDKIAIFHRHTGKAEAETAQRIALAAERLGIHAQEVASAADITAFNPDCVVCLSHDDGKITPYPTYGMMLAPLSWFQASPEDIRSILSYDGYLTVSDSVKDWLTQITTAWNGKPSPIAEVSCTVQATESLPLGQPPDGPLRLAYVGTNWDGWRSLALFKILAARGDVFFYGPKASWQHVSQNAYGGPVPFDGRSVLDLYRRCGVGLALDRQDFRKDDMPTNRIFEITAAGAVAIAGDLPFIRRNFGDSVLYIAPDTPPSVQAWQIGQHLAWIAEHPTEAAAMARAAHATFNQNWALERLLPRLNDMHDQTSTGRHGFQLGTLPGTEARFRDFCRAWLASHGPGQPETIEISQEMTVSMMADGLRLNADLLALHGPAAIEVYLDANRLMSVPLNEAVMGELTVQGHLGRLRPSAPAMQNNLTLPAALPVVGAVVRVAISNATQTLAEATLRRRTWIFGSGLGGQIMAKQIRQLENRHIAGFIDDFRLDEQDGLPVMPLAEAALRMAPEDCVILANQHWETLWPKLFALPPRHLYCAHPDYGIHLLALPKPRAAPS